MTDAPEPKYQVQTIKTVRGLEKRTRDKYERLGWEFVSQTTGTVRSELNFRRVAPKTPWVPLAILGGVVVTGFAVLGVMSLVNNANGVSEAQQRPTAMATSTPANTPEPTRTSTTAPTPEATAVAPTSSPVALPQETTVDALLDKLNSADMGGSRPGDRYHLIGQAFMKQYWFAGATGDYAVSLSAQGGAQDLMILTDESTAASWQEGTLLDLVLEDVERTIDGETSSGWLLVVSSSVVG